MLLDSESSSDDIRVSFEHWSCTFHEEKLRKYGSRYFSRKEAGVEYAREIYKRSNRISSHDLKFTARQIRAGNEAFPEAAVADPIADLQVWDEWRSGSRYFPYPGRYSKLGITKQDDKTSSPSSVGVLGEIMAGLFAQVGVWPLVLVRVVRRWPDFIFSHQNGSYSFVESKAFTGDPSGDTGLRARVVDRLIIEGALDATQQLVSDPFGKVWYSVTRVVGITPLSLEVTFLELNVPDSLRQSKTDRPMPQAAVDGLAERAVNQAAALFDPLDLEKRLADPLELKYQTIQQIRRMAQEEVEDLIAEVGDACSPSDRESITAAVGLILDKLAKKKWKPRAMKDVRGRRFVEAKREAAECRLSWIRRSGEVAIYLADLPKDELSRIGRDCAGDWSRAIAPWGVLDGTELWRCGGAVLCLGGGRLAGRDIREALRSSPESSRG
jgi:hypothetical protein